MSEQLIVHVARRAADLLGVELPARIDEARRLHVGSIEQGRRADAWLRRLPDLPMLTVAHPSLLEELQSARAHLAKWEKLEREVELVPEDSPHTLADPLALKQALRHAWGHYQERLLRSEARWSGADLRGKAARFAGKYSASRAFLVYRLCDDPQLLVSRCRTPRGRIVYRISSKLRIEASQEPHDPDRERLPGGLPRVPLDADPAAAA